MLLKVLHAVLLGVLILLMMLLWNHHQRKEVCWIDCLVFSVAGIVVDKRHAVLTAEKINALVFLNKNSFFGG